MLVEVYRNLNNGKWSIRDAVTGYVAGHAETVVLADAEFIVNEAGRQRVIREQRKNVHAYVKGTLLEAIRFKPFRGRKIFPANLGHWNVLYSVPVTYNPYLTSSFVDAELTDQSIQSADRVVLDTYGRVEANLYAFPKSLNSDPITRSLIGTIKANAQHIAEDRKRMLQARAS